MNTSPASIRIGTWNMEGRGGASQTNFLLAQQCDVLLLTEVPISWSLPGYHLTRDGELMQPTKRWAAIASRAPLAALPLPHPASVAAIVDGVTYVSSILPWRSSRDEHPWRGETLGERATNAIGDLTPFLRSCSSLVWGGDWNQPFADPDYVGSRDGRVALTQLTTDLGLTIATRTLPHQKAGITAIDHIALRGTVHSAERVVAAERGAALSDHDFYVVHATLSSHVATPSTVSPTTGSVTNRAAVVPQEETGQRSSGLPPLDARDVHAFEVLYRQRDSWRPFQLQGGSRFTNLGSAVFGPLGALAALAGTHRTCRIEGHVEAVMIRAAGTRMLFGALDGQTVMTTVSSTAQLSRRDCQALLTKGEPCSRGLWDDH